MAPSIPHRPVPSPRDARAVAVHGRARAGFSLVELVTVLVIVGVLSAVAVPRYANSLSHYKADAAARQLIADLNRAAAAARSSSRPVSVVFDASNERYAVQGVVIVLRRGGSDVRDLASEISGGNLVSASFAGQPTLTFDGYGRGSADGTILLRFGDNVRTISFDAASGRASFTRTASAAAAEAEGEK